MSSAIDSTKWPTACNLPNATKKILEEFFTNADSKADNAGTLMGNLFAQDGTMITATGVPLKGPQGKTCNSMNNSSSQ